MRNSLVKIRILLVAIATLSLSSIATAQSIASLEPEMKAAQSIDDVVSVIAKFSEYENTIAERLVIYDQIPRDILDIRSKIDHALTLVASPADAAYASEFIYLTALDARLKTNLLSRITKLRFQDALSKQFLATANDWRVEIESGVSFRSIEPNAQTEALEQEKISEQQINRLINVAEALLESLDETERVSLAKRQRDWIRATKNDLRRDVGKIRMDQFNYIRKSVAKAYKTGDRKQNFHIFLSQTAVFGLFSTMATFTFVRDGGIFGFAAIGVYSLLAADSYGSRVQRILRQQADANQSHGRVGELKFESREREKALDAFFNEIEGIPKERKNMFRCIAGAIGKK